MNDQLPVIRHSIHQAKQIREIHLNTRFNKTKEYILRGKKYHDIAMSLVNNPRRYKQFRSWAKNQPCYQRLVNGSPTLQKDFSDHCDLVNNAVKCAEHWEVIKSNICDERITHVDVRKLEIDQLARAKSLTWCIYYNGQCSGFKNPPDPDEEGVYDTDDVNRIFEFVVNNPVMTKIDHQPNKATSLMKTTSLKVISHCRSLTE